MALLETLGPSGTWDTRYQVLYKGKKHTECNPHSHRHTNHIIMKFSATTYVKTRAELFERINKQLNQ